MLLLLVACVRSIPTPPAPPADPCPLGLGERLEVALPPGEVLAATAGSRVLIAVVEEDRRMSARIVEGSSVGDRFEIAPEAIAPAVVGVGDRWLVAWDVEPYEEERLERWVEPSGAMSAPSISSDDRVFGHDAEAARLRTEDGEQWTVAVTEVPHLGHEIVLSRVGPDGAPLGEPVQLSRARDSATRPSVLAVPDGVLVGWVDNDYVHGSVPPTAWIREIDRSGQPREEARPVGTMQYPGWQAGLVASPAGPVLVLGDGVIQRLDTDGRPIGNPDALTAQDWIGWLATPTGPAVVLAAEGGVALAPVVCGGERARDRFHPVDQQADVDPPALRPSGCTLRHDRWFPVATIEPYVQMRPQAAPLHLAGHADQLWVGWGIAADWLETGGFGDAGFALRRLDVGSGRWVAPPRTWAGGGWLASLGALGDDPLIVSADPHLQLRREGADPAVWSPATSDGLPAVAVSDGIVGVLWASAGGEVWFRSAPQEALDRPSTARLVGYHHPWLATGRPRLAAAPEGFVLAVDRIDGLAPLTARLDATGEVRWTASLTGGGADRVHDLAVFGDQVAVVTVRTASPSPFVRLARLGLDGTRYGEVDLAGDGVVAAAIGSDGALAVLSREDGSSCAARFRLDGDPIGPKACGAGPAATEPWEVEPPAYALAWHQGALWAASAAGETDLGVQRFGCEP
ncbi:MAG: hypothetical protein ABMB14_08855 [Myxococcota bacterium]